MFYIFITIFVIASGLTAADEKCSTRLNDVCEPDTELFFPKNAEDLERFCSIMIKALECAIEHEERCHSLPGFFPDAYQYLATFHEVCNPDTLLNGAVSTNLECFSEKVLDEAREICYEDVPSDETLEKQAEELSKDLEALTDNDENEENLHFCLNELNNIACRAILTEKKCGTVAKDAFVEVVRKLPPIFGSCTDQAIQKLPTIIRLRELENEVEEALKRRRK